MIEKTSDELKKLVKSTFVDLFRSFTAYELEEKGWTISDIDQSVQENLIIEKYRHPHSFGWNEYCTPQMQNYEHLLENDLKKFIKTLVLLVEDVMIDYNGSEIPNHWSTIIKSDLVNLTDVLAVKEYFGEDSQIHIAPSADNEDHPGENYISICIDAPKDKFLNIPKYESEKK